jgi:repressor LexA
MAMEKLTSAQQELYDWLVQYIRTTQYAPSIRQMMRAMKLKSPAPVQSRLERLRAKGYIDWSNGKARTIRILHPVNQNSIPVLGAIAAGGLVEPFNDVEEKLDLSLVINQPNCYALRVMGDSMIDDLITEDDLVILRSINSNEQVKNGEIVAARVEGSGTTLKRFYREGNYVILRPSNKKYPPLKILANLVEIQGVLVGVWRFFNSALPHLS